jgi:hypothetical protein
MLYLDESGWSNLSKEEQAQGVEFACRFVDPLIHAM